MTTGIFSILAHLQDGPEMVGAAGGEPGLEVLAEFRPGHLVKILNFHL
jgi:hypothetical protein